MLNTSKVGNLAFSAGLELAFELAAVVNDES